MAHLSSPRQGLAVAVAGLLLSLAVAACSDSPLSPDGPSARPPAGPRFALVPGVDTAYTSTVCVAGPPGSSAVTLSVWPDRVVPPTGVSGTLLVPVPFALNPGECRDVYRGGEFVDGIYFREASTPPGTSIKKISVRRKGPDCSASPSFCAGDFTGTDQVYMEVFFGRGFTITFVNQAQGCSAAYWKSHPSAWSAAGVLPLPPLLAILGLSGNVNNDFAREGLAALLNSLHPAINYDLSLEQVATMTRSAVLPGGNVAATTATFQNFNSQPCPLP